VSIYNLPKLRKEGRTCRNKQPCSLIQRETETDPGTFPTCTNQFQMISYGPVSISRHCHEEKDSLINKPQHLTTIFPLLVTRNAPNILMVGSTISLVPSSTIPIRSFNRLVGAYRQYCPTLVRFGFCCSWRYNSESHFLATMVSRESQGMQCGSLYICSLFRCSIDPLKYVALSTRFVRRH
jgi:hypothetical protein